MISSRLRPSTITIYAYAGDDVNRKPTYTRTLVSKVFLDLDYQTAQERRGIASKDTAQVVIDLTVSPMSSLNFPPNSFFVEGDCSDTIPAKSKQEIAAARKVYEINRAWCPPCGRETPVILELYAR